ncbi:MAG: hypothetical protein AAGA56_31040, partial [Myxococcota bacterium]
MTEKKNWAEVDKRIRDRRPTWTKEEKDALEQQLQSLPDVADQAEAVSIVQPVFAAEQPAEGDAESTEETPPPVPGIPP